MFGRGRRAQHFRETGELLLTPKLEYWAKAVFFTLLTFTSATTAGFSAGVAVDGVFNDLDFTESVFDFNTPTNLESVVGAIAALTALGAYYIARKGLTEMNFNHVGAGGILWFDPEKSKNW